jgi:hypothetical protein
MRKKVSSPGRMHDYLLVAGVYAVVFLIAWLFAKAHLEPSQSPSAHSGAGERVTLSVPAADGDRDTGRLIVLSPGGCRYAEFRNGSPDAFAVAPADCDLLGRSVDPTGALGGQATSRIEAIGKYFRRQP